MKARLKEGARLALLILSFLVFRSIIFDHYTVPSESMEPTIQIGDRVLVNKLSYGVRLPFSHVYLWKAGDPARGDVVILDSPRDGRTLIKRVIGRPGDELAVISGRIYVDGQEIPVENGEGDDSQVERIDKRHHPVRLGSGGPDWGPTRIPEGQFLVMGDNRANSLDGRIFGYAPRGTILGRAARIYWRDGWFSWAPLENLEGE